MHSRLFAVFVAVLAASFAWVAWQASDPLARPSAAPKARTAAPEPLRSIAVERVVDQRRLADADSRAIRVVRRDGTPIEGADLRVCDRARFHLTDEPRTLLRTSSAGECELAATVLLGLEGQRIAVVAKGFETAVLDPMVLEKARDRVTEVRLAEAFELTILASDQDGNPVPNARFAISAASLQEDLSGPENVTESQPGDDPGSAIYVARTDAAGVARFRDLRAGKYDARYVGLDMFPVQGLFGTSWSVPGPPLRVILTPCLAAVVRVTGDELLRSVPTLPEGAMVFGVTDAVCERIQNNLRERFPDCSVWATIGSIENKPDKASVPAAQLLLLGRQTPWTETFVPLLPVAEITEPTVIELRPATTAPELAAVILRYPHGVGAVLGDHQVYIEVTGTPPPVTRMTFDLVPDAAVAVQAGTCRLRATDPYVDRLLQQEPPVRLRPGETRELAVQVPVEIRAVLISIINRDGRPLQRADLEIHLPDIPRPAVYFGAPLDRLHVFPVGKPVGISVRAFGHDQTQGTWTVPGDGREPYEIVIALQ